MTADELKEIIDTAFDAVNASKVGPVYVKPDGGTPTRQTLACEVLVTIIAQLVPKSVDVAAEMNEPKENWEEQ